MRDDAIRNVRLFVRPLPFVPYKRALEVVREANNAFIALDDWREELGKYKYPNMMKELVDQEGKKGVERLENEKEHLRNKEELLSAEAVKAVQECYEKVQKELNEMFEIKPEHLQGSNAALVAMLNSEIIESEEELTKLIDENKTNPTFIRLAMKYAEKKDCRKLLAINLTEERLRNGMESIFDQILTGARNLGGYTSMLCSTDSIAEDFIESYDLLPEYREFLKENPSYQAQASERIKLLFSL